jgi:hypothetical protein
LTSRPPPWFPNHLSYCLNQYKDMVKSLLPTLATNIPISRSPSYNKFRYQMHNRSLEYRISINTRPNEFGQQRLVMLAAQIWNSCVAEPMALVKALRCLAASANPHGVCVYSDHTPLVDVLNRAAGGLAHSAAYLWAAKALREMQYDINGHGAVRPGDVSDLQGSTLEIRHIPGSANPADGISRGVYRPPLLDVTRIG